MSNRRRTALSLAAALTFSALGVAAGHAAPNGASNKVTIAFPYQPDTMDPAVGGQTIQFQIDRNILDTLLWMKPNGKLAPDIATKWKISDGGKTYTLFLRKGVKFTDGTSFNAQAVVDEFNRAVNPASHSLSAAAALGPYQSSQAVNNYEVVIHLKSPYAPLLTNLATPVLGIPSPSAVKKYGSSFGEHVVGSGPYMLTSWTKGSSMTLTRNPNYNWAPPALHHSGPASIAQIVYDFVESGQVRTDELQTGQAQLMDSTPGLSYLALQKNPQFTAEAVSLGGTGEYAFINNSAFPTNDKAVREAMLYGVDVPGVVKLADQGVYPVIHGPLQRGMLGYEDAVLAGMYPYNPAKAEKVLQADGWKKVNGIYQKNGKQLTIKLISIPVEDLTSLAQALQGYLQKIGMNVQLQQMAEPAWTAAWEHGQENLSTTWLTGLDSDILRESWVPGQTFNWNKYSNPQVTRLFDKAEVVSKPSTRASLYKQGEKIIMRDAATIPLHENDDLVVMTSSLKGITSSGGNLVFTDATLG